MYETSPFLLLYILLIAFLFGAVLGSFIDCAAWRLVHQERISGGRSHCDVCGHPLSVGDLIPIVSYLRAGGRCRYCGTRFSPESTFVELFLGLSFAVLVYHYDLSFTALRYLGLLVILTGLSLVDQKTYTIPDRFQIAGILWWLLTLPLMAWNRSGLTQLLSATGRRLPGTADVLLDGLGRAMASSDAGAALASAGGTGQTAFAFLRNELFWSLLSAFGISVFMLLLTLLFDRLTGKESMGGGDIKLYFMTGLYLRPGIAAFNLILSCIVGLLLAFFFKKEKLPFGPAISIATFLSLLVGSGFITWYNSLLV